jgi:regulator of sirC expression with transglutaminase-like and TPR domain
MGPDEYEAANALTYADELGREEPRLLVAALLFAREIEHRDMLPSRYLRRLDDWAAMMRDHLPRGASQLESAVEVSRFLTDDLLLRGNQEEYYDAANSFLNEVIERRVGLPITLSALFLHFAEVAGLRAEGIGLPGHFVVAVRIGGRQHFFDPFEGTGPLDVEELRELLQERTGFRGPIDAEWLEPQPVRSILARMLFNLRGVYLGKNDWSRAAQVVERLIATQPGVPAHLRDLGFIYARGGRPLSAAQMLQRYLLAEPGADDAAMLRGSIDSLIEQGARLN